MRNRLYYVITRHLPSMLPREEHLKLSKEAALALLSAGRMREAVSSMMTNIVKSPSSALPHEIHAFGICAAAAGDTRAVREYIEGFI
ncbi:hypothetical protein [Bradyrhizobium sp. ERR14]|uniref:hypothetical protein n=1 Tax=Bradyrhizobium sp. ERR14 TaxID=2663837 RepID=UPI0016199AA5|nr:hypothetical protein [Bradyrhizobium sp. ERR14]MBB4392463.1 hypothetical protein [Bradyrhizobium sp. ERR14]